MGTTGDSLIYKSCEESVVDPRESLCYDPNGQVTHPTTIRHSARHGHSLMTCYDTIVVEVTAIVNQDDACSMAVYFGPRSRFNRRAVKDGCDWREGIAFVVFEALTHAIKIRSKISHKVKKILVMVDDAYLVDILTSNSNNTASRSIIIGQIRRRIYEFARDGVEVCQCRILRFMVLTFRDQILDRSSSSRVRGRPHGRVYPTRAQRT